MVSTITYRVGKELNLLLSGNTKFSYKNTHIFFRVNWEERVSNVSHAAETVEKRENYLIGYTVLITLAVVVFIYRTVAFFRFCLRCAGIVHMKMVRAVIRAKMEFFHDNSSGRILNRFTKDTESMDVLLPNMTLDCFDVSHHSIRKTKTVD